MPGLSKTVSISVGQSSRPIYCSNFTLFKVAWLLFYNLFLNIIFQPEIKASKSYRHQKASLVLLAPLLRLEAVQQLLALVGLLALAVMHGEQVSQLSWLLPYYSWHGCSIRIRLCYWMEVSYTSFLKQSTSEPIRRKFDEVIFKEDEAWERS
jgi:hypothetical protein